MLLVKLEKSLRAHEDIGAFADDIAAVVSDYKVSMPALAVLFQEFEAISSLQLNVKKTIFIPLWQVADVDSLRSLLREISGFWKDVLIQNKGKYLGFQIGPGAGQSSWEKPMSKYEQALHHWSALKLGLFMNTLAYNIHIVTLLEYVAQLHEVTDEIGNLELWAFRRLAPGPGNWVMPNDLENLRSLGLTVQFRSVSHTARAAKLRICATVAKDTKSKHAMLMDVQVEHMRRPFGAWHERCYYRNLSDNLTLLQGIGVTVQTVSRQLVHNADPCRHAAQD